MWLESKDRHKGSRIDPLGPHVFQILRIWFTYREGIFDIRFRVKSSQQVLYKTIFKPRLKRVCIVPDRLVASMAV